LAIMPAMKHFAFSLALLVIGATAAFADTLPQQVKSEASRLLTQVDAAGCRQRPPSRR
jgi:hypothetical protein